MTLSTEFERLDLDLEEPFTIARGTQEVAPNFVVRIDDGEHEGVGAAAPSRRYGETPETVAAVLPDLLAAVEEVDDPHQLDRIGSRMDGLMWDNPAAKAAVDVALYDLVCKRLDLPLYRYLGADPARTVESSFTVGLADLDEMRRKTRTAVAAGHDVLKVKLGTDRDLDVVETVREAAPDARLRVDANEAWAPAEAVSKIDALAAYGVEFVEQPVPAENPEGMGYVYERAALPIAADESCVTLADVPEVAGMADVANLKLMKCGGVRAAIRIIHAARAHGLEVMLGCMIETNAAIAAALHLTPLVDYADLDGSQLLAHDPYAALDFGDGAVDLRETDRPGTGAYRRA